MKAEDAAVCLTWAAFQFLYTAQPRSYDMQMNTKVAWKVLEQSMTTDNFPLRFPSWWKNRTTGQEFLIPNIQIQEQLFTKFNLFTPCLKLWTSNLTVVSVDINIEENSMTCTAVQLHQGAKEFGWGPLTFYYLIWLSPLPVRQRRKKICFWVIHN